MRWMLMVVALAAVACETSTDGGPDDDTAERYGLAGHVWQVDVALGTQEAAWHPGGASGRVCLDFTSDRVAWWSSTDPATSSDDASGDLGAWLEVGPLESWGMTYDVGGETWDVYAVPDRPRDEGRGLWRVDDGTATNWGLYPGDTSCGGI